MEATEGLGERGIWEEGGDFTWETWVQCVSPKSFIDSKTLFPEVRMCLIADGSAESTVVRPDGTEFFRGGELPWVCSSLQPRGRPQ